MTDFWWIFQQLNKCDNGSVTLGWNETQELSFGKWKRLRLKRRAFSIRTRSGSRSLKLPFRKCCIFFVFYLLLCVAIWASLNLSRIVSFKRSWELLLEVSTWLYVLSITLELKIKEIAQPNVFFTIIFLLVFAFTT